ncbi:serine protease inhibitor [Rivularia sp. PCC 7116]|uniref:serpin family protein n=1 Tax=Rivularia sp. PCC 7116 TaxID=373994 RepID=UPI00029EE3D8|nr:serpin family protein [Rivularia sp. PCC 7116]AFY53009.1 serine protease inhibitor [Rivularia sp. PCC 7116]
MKQNLSNARQNFLQRRYAVSLGRRYVLAAASVMLMGVIGCSQLSNSNNRAFAQSQTPQSELPISDKPASIDTEIVSANTKFGFNLFSQLLIRDNSKNIFFSPSSIALALSMTYNGASGSTQEEMAQALELQGMSLQQINSNYAELKASLENPDPQVTLNIANSLWVDRNTSLKPKFIESNQNYYQAQVTNLNFADTRASDQINDWVRENTEGKIDKIINKINPDEVLFLLNAIYFKGSWKKEFQSDKTAEFPFYLSSGEEKQHPMMSQSGDYTYYETENFQAVSLPYGENGRVSFYIFLPKQNSELKLFYDNLNAANWEKWMSKFVKREGFVRIPRFKTDYETTLNDALSALGMQEAFSNNANFSEMGNNLKISQVKHKTFVEVNEEGTEAAATTSVGIQLTSAQLPSQKPFEMIVNRPFFCAIRDNQTRSILFMGSIIEPIDSKKIDS